MAIKHIGMARWRFGISRHHQIRAQIQRALQQGGHGGVVDNQLRPNGMGLARRKRQVAAIEPGVGGGFDENNRGARKICAVHIRGRNQAHLYAQRGQELLG